MQRVFWPTKGATAIRWAITHAVLWMYILGVAYAPNPYNIRAERKAITDSADGFIRFQDENLSIQTCTTTDPIERRNAYIKIRRPGTYKLYYDPYMRRRPPYDAEVRFGEIVYFNAQGEKVVRTQFTHRSDLIPFQEENCLVYQSFTSTAALSLLVFLQMKLRHLKAYQFENRPLIRITYDQPVSYDAHPNPEAPTTSTGRSYTSRPEDAVDTEHRQLDRCGSSLDLELRLGSNPLMAELTRDKFT